MTGSAANSVAPERHEQSRELPGAGGKVEHGAAGTDVEVVGEPRHRVGRVRGADPLVRLGPATEAFLGDFVDCHSAIFAGGSVASVRLASRSVRGQESQPCRPGVPGVDDRRTGEDVVEGPMLAAEQDPDEAEAEKQE